MTEITPRGSQLDRIDDKLDQVLDRLTRMEARQDNHGGKIEAHDALLREHSTKIHELSVAHAVTAATGKQGQQQLNGRWAAVGATALVVLGSIGAFIGNVLITVFKS